MITACPKPFSNSWGSQLAL